MHAGLYYRPGSLKARLCLAGLHASYAYFSARGIPFRRAGKVVVALHEADVPALERLHANALANGVPNVRLLDGDGLRAVEPACAGVAAVHSPETGIVDWGSVARAYAADVRALGGDVLLNARVVGLEEGDPVRIAVESGGDRHFVSSERVVSCAGARSDEVAALSGGARDPQIVPVRGEYLRLADAAARRIRGNIYPVPDANVPFLGVHFTPTMRGDVIVGPNAVLAFARDGYDYSTVRVGEMWQMVTYKGFWRLARKNWAYAAGEMYRSVVLSAAAKRACQYVPSLSVSDFSRMPSERNGVRGQAVNALGELVDEFLFEEDDCGRIIHTRNAPSPGATSSLPIGGVIADRLLKS